MIEGGKGKRKRVPGEGPVPHKPDKRPEYRVLAQAAIVTAFNTVEVATQHTHWHKEAEDVECVVGPLCRIIETLPAPVLKAFEKRFNTIALVGGIAYLVVPDVTAEIKIRNAERVAKAQESAARGPQASRPINSPGPAPNGRGGAPGGPGEGIFGEQSGEWVDATRDTLPAPDVAVDYRY